MKLTTGRLLGVACFLVACAVFGAMAYFAHQLPMFPGDLEITRAVQQFRSPLFDVIAGALLWMGLPPEASVIYGSYAVLFALFRRWWDGLMELAAAVGGGALYLLIEPLVSRPRPSPDLVYVSGPLQMGSFPSGHAAIFVAVYGLFIFLLARGLRPSLLRTLLFVVLGALIIGIGLARIYHGQHWPSDVVAGWLMGAIWLGVVVTIHNLGAAKWHRSSHPDGAR